MNDVEAYRAALRSSPYGVDVEAMRLKFLEAGPLSIGEMRKLFEFVDAQSAALHDMQEESSAYQRGVVDGMRTQRATEKNAGTIRNALSYAMQVRGIAAHLADDLAPIMAHYLSLRPDAEPTVVAFQHRGKQLTLRLEEYTEVFYGGRNGALMGPMTAVGYVAGDLPDDWRAADDYRLASPEFTGLIRIRDANSPRFLSQGPYTCPALEARRNM